MLLNRDMESKGESDDMTLGAPIAFLPESFTKDESKESFAMKLMVVLEGTLCESSAEVHSKCATCKTNKKTLCISMLRSLRRMLRDSQLSRKQFASDINEHLMLLIYATQEQLTNLLLASNTPSFGIKITRNMHMLTLNLVITFLRGAKKAWK